MAPRLDKLGIELIAPYRTNNKERRYEDGRRVRLCSANAPYYSARSGMSLRQSGARHGFPERTPDFAAQPPACIRLQIIAVRGRVPEDTGRMLSNGFMACLGERGFCP
jgi:hypothetical protein